MEFVNRILSRQAFVYPFVSVLPRLTTPPLFFGKIVSCPAGSLSAAQVLEKTVEPIEFRRSKIDDFHIHLGHCQRGPAERETFGTPTTVQNHVAKRPNNWTLRRLSCTLRLVGGVLRRVRVMLVFETRGVTLEGVRVGVSASNSGPVLFSWIPSG